MEKGCKTMPKTSQNRQTTPVSAMTTIRLKTLKDRGDQSFDLSPAANHRAGLASELGLKEIRKLRLNGAIRGLNTKDWQLEAIMGATVVQPCVVTGAPVTTRLDVPVRRVYLSGYDLPDIPGELEFDGDDEAEPLCDSVDLLAVMAESLALALPQYPRAPGAELGEAVFTAPGLTPMRDEDVKPFAGLAALRDKLDE